jgi:predicted dehydrogenase
VSRSAAPPQGHAAEAAASGMTPAPLRWGVLGVANIAVKQVIPALQQSPHARVEAIASRERPKAEAAARSLGIPRAHGSYEALLADPEVEAVYIPLPNHLHVPWTIRAAEAGKHVLCEKPIACSAAEARELLAVRARTGRLIAEAFMVRSHPQWHRVRELLAAGRIGELRLVVGHFSYYRRDPDDVRSRPEYGGGVLLDIGCYPVTLSRWLYGAEPLEVAAVLERDPEFTVDRLVSGLLRFPSGQACFTVAGQAVPFQRMQLFGTRGRIEVEIPFNAPGDRDCRLLVDDGRDLAGGGIEVVTVGGANQYTLQGDAFWSAVHGRGAVSVPVEDAVANMAVLDALLRAAGTGRWERPAA